MSLANTSCRASASEPTGDGVPGAQPPRVEGVSLAKVRTDERGQAVVELALVLPLVVLFVFGALQVAVVARDQLAIEYVAREAARAAAVSADPAGAAKAAAGRVAKLAPIDVSVSVAGDVVRVRVRYVNATDVALVGVAISDVTLEATAAMAWEPPLR